MALTVCPFRGGIPLFLVVLTAVVNGGLTENAAAQNKGGPMLPPQASVQKPASQLIRKQEPPHISQHILDQATPQNVTINISLGKQRAYFLVNGVVAIDTPISSGKRAGMTPQGSFKILEKDANHRSNIFGNYVSARSGQIVRAGISSKIDSAPSGTVYSGAPMHWFMRLTDGGVGMHTGYLPGYPASHGCVRLPEEIAHLFYDHVVVGIPVTIAE